MFSSKFECLAEIEALRAGFKPSMAAAPYIPPGPAPLPSASSTGDATDEPTASALKESDIRAEMERRLAARLVLRGLA